MRSPPETVHPKVRCLELLKRLKESAQGQRPDASRP
jgi:hypothetical protein